MRREIFWPKMFQKCSFSHILVDWIASQFLASRVFRTRIRNKARIKGVWGYLEDKLLPTIRQLFLPTLQNVINLPPFRLEKQFWVNASHYETSWQLEGFKTPWVEKDWKNYNCPFGTYPPPGGVQLLRDNTNCKWF